MEAETATRQDSVEPLEGSSLRSLAAEVTPVVRGMGGEDEVGQAPRTPRRPPRPPSDGGAARRRSIINAKNERRNSLQSWTLADAACEPPTNLHGHLPPEEIQRRDTSSVLHSRGMQSETSSPAISMATSPSMTPFMTPLASLSADPNTATDSPRESSRAAAAKLAIDSPRANHAAAAANLLAEEMSERRPPEILEHVEGDADVGRVGGDRGYYADQDQRASGELVAAMLHDISSEHAFGAPQLQMEEPQGCVGGGSLFERLEWGAAGAPRAVVTSGDSKGRGSTRAQHVAVVGDGGVGRGHGGVDVRRHSLMSKYSDDDDDDDDDDGGEMIYNWTHVHDDEVDDGASSHHGDSNQAGDGHGPAAVAADAQQDAPAPAPAPAGFVADQLPQQASIVQNQGRKKSNLAAIIGDGPGDDLVYVVAESLRWQQASAGQGRGGGIPASGHQKGVPPWRDVAGDWEKKEGKNAEEVVYWLQGRGGLLLEKKGGWGSNKTRDGGVSRAGVQSTTERADENERGEAGHRRGVEGWGPHGDGNLQAQKLKIGVRTATAAASKRYAGAVVAPPAIARARPHTVSGGGASSYDILGSIATAPAGVGAAQVLAFGEGDGSSHGSDSRIDARGAALEGQQYVASERVRLPARDFGGSPKVPERVTLPARDFGGSPGVSLQAQASPFAVAAAHSGLNSSPRTEAGSKAAGASPRIGARPSTMSPRMDAAAWASPKVGARRPSTAAEVPTSSQDEASPRPGSPRTVLTETSDAMSPRTPNRRLSTANATLGRPRMASLSEWGDDEVEEGAFSRSFDITEKPKMAEISMGVGQNSPRLLPSSSPGVNRRTPSPRKSVASARKRLEGALGNVVNTRAGTAPMEGTPRTSSQTLDFEGTKPHPPDVLILADSSPALRPGPTPLSEAPPPLHPPARDANQQPLPSDALPILSPMDRSSPLSVVPNLPRPTTATSSPALSPCAPELPNPSPPDCSSEYLPLHDPSLPPSDIFEADKGTGPESSDPATAESSSKAAQTLHGTQPVKQPGEASSSPRAGGGAGGGAMVQGQSTMSPRAGKRIPYFTETTVRAGPLTPALMASTKTVEAGMLPGPGRGARASPRPVVVSPSNPRPRPPAALCFAADGGRGKGSQPVGHVRPWTSSSSNQGGGCVSSRAARGSHVVGERPRTSTAAGDLVLEGGGLDHVREHVAAERQKRLSFMHGEDGGWKVEGCEEEEKGGGGANVLRIAATSSPHFTFSMTPDADAVEGLADKRVMSSDVFFGRRESSPASRMSHASQPHASHTATADDQQQRHSNHNHHKVPAEGSPESTFMDADPFMEKRPVQMRPKTVGYRVPDHPSRLFAAPDDEYQDKFGAGGGIGGALWGDGGGAEDSNVWHADGNGASHDGPRSTPLKDITWDDPKAASPRGMLQTLCGWELEESSETLLQSNMASIGERASTAGEAGQHQQVVARRPLQPSSPSSSSSLLRASTAGEAGNHQRSVRRPLQAHTQSSSSSSSLPSTSHGYRRPFPPSREFTTPASPSTLARAVKGKPEGIPFEIVFGSGVPLTRAQTSHSRTGHSSGRVGTAGKDASHSAAVTPRARTAAASTRDCKSPVLSPRSALRKGRVLTSVSLGGGPRRKGAGDAKDTRKGGAKKGAGGKGAGKGGLGLMVKADGMSYYYRVLT